MTEEEIETVVEQYLRSKRLFKPHDLTLVNVSRDKLLLDIFSNGKGKKEELLEGQFMGTNKVVSRIIDNTTACYKISTCDKRPIIRSVLHFGLQPTFRLFTITQRRHTEPDFCQRRPSQESQGHIHIRLRNFQPQHRHSCRGTQEGMRVFYNRATRPA